MVNKNSLKQSYIIAFCTKEKKRKKKKERLQNKAETAIWFENLEAAPILLLTKVTYNLT